jgi:hypothetical protein
VGPEGLVVGERREIGYARFAGAAQPAPDTDEEVPGQDGVPGQPDDGVPLPTWGK